MQTLRQLTLLTRLVLVGFVLSLGVAVASPMVKPQNTLLVCTGMGVMQVVADADANAVDTDVAPTLLDCPLCAALAVPVSLALAAEQPRAVAFFLGHRGNAGARIVARTAAALPPRGPPLAA